MRLERDRCVGGRCFALFSIMALLFLSAWLLPAGARAAVELTRQQLQAALDTVPKDAGRKTLAPYFFVFTDDPDVDRLPLKSTSVKVDIAGVVARVRVTQIYRNQGRKPLEAVYIFPASTRAAVQAMRMTIGERTIVAEIKKRAEARREYEKALSEGRTASLLEQQRPNVFQISVGNILPADEIKVELEYSELLVPEHGQYEFVYPTVVGPRYSNRPKTGSSEPERWVENPYLHQGENADNTLAIDVNIRSGIPIARVVSPSHDVSVEFTGRNQAHITQTESAEAGNRDFVVRYRLAGDAIEHGLLLYPGEEENFFMLMMEPPQRTAERDIVDREYIFIMDVSGSMCGYPLETTKGLMRDLLGGLRARDYFNLILFAGSSAALSSNSLPVTSDNIQDALDLVDTQQGGGGTELLPALRKALALPRKENTARVLIVLTDGYVDVEKESFELVRSKLGQANLFAFGIGTAVNRFLIEGLARAGMGEPFVVLDAAEARKQAARFREYVSAPLLTGIEVDFDGFEAYDTEPGAMPDLFAERPLVILGKYRGKPSGEIVISGRAAGEDYEGRIRLEDAIVSEDNRALKTLWARRRLASLADDVKLQADDEQVAEITRLGLKYKLLSDYTSFVAIDTEVRADGKKVTRVRQPLPLPFGLSDSAVGGLGTHGFGGVAGRLSGSVKGRAMGRAMVMGSLDRGVIQRTISKNLRSIQACYEKALRSNPSLCGKIVVSFTIGPKGTVTSARIASATIADYQMQADVLSVIRRMKFPKPTGGGSINISYPFIFRSP
ncbi:MAG TPA: TonB family protein [Myxococcota bacterium]|nr:TonB family protein [Myxococcota bacterium]